MFRPPMPDFRLLNLAQMKQGTARLVALLLLVTISPVCRVQAVGATAGFEQDKSSTSENAEITTLELGKAIERKLSGGEKHAYQIMLTAGQFASVTVEQRGIDVIVRLIGTDGKQADDFDSEVGVSGQERAERVAETDGYYRLVVEAKGPKATASGSYEVRWAEMRASTDKDRSLQEARRLYAEAIRLRRAGKYDEAIRLGQQGLEILENVHGPEHRDVAAALNNLGETYRLKGEYGKAEETHLRALHIREKVLGKDHLHVAYSLNNLGLLAYETGDFVQAEQLNKRALEIKEKALGRDHFDLANSLNNLAMIYSDRREFIKTEALFQRALDIREKALGPEHPDVAASFNNLAVLYLRKGDYTRAVLLFERALTIREKTLPPGHPSIASALNNLASVHYKRGDFVKAEQLNQRALEMREKALGPDHLYVAYSLTNLADIYTLTGDYAKAQPLCERALKIKEKALSPEHPDLASSIITLASVYYARHELEKAESLYLRAQAIFEKARGQEHPDVTTALEGLARIAIDRGDRPQAEQLYGRMLRIREKALGEHHPEVATVLDQLATLAAAKGDSVRAIAAQIRAYTIIEHNLAINLATGSEREKLAYLASLSTFTDRTLSLHLQVAPENSSAQRLAAITILQRKGRVLDAMSDSLTALRRHLTAPDQALLDTLNDTTTRLAGLVLNGPQKVTPTEYQSQIRDLAERREELEREVSRRTAGFYQTTLPITLADVQAMIPTDAALIEFAIYHPFDSTSTDRKQAYGEPRYVAYVVRHTGEVQWKELGDAREIDDAIDRLRAALRDPRREDAQRLAREVDQRIMQPIRALLTNETRLLISPDGALNLIPFEALVDEQNTYLIHHYSISYLTSGRDLLRLNVGRTSKSAPTVIAAPWFGEPVTAQVVKAVAPIAKSAPFGKKRQSVTTGEDLSNIYFAPLDGAAQEAQAIKSLFPDSSMLIGQQATESALKQVTAPRLLHIATHGFFLREAASNATRPALDTEVAETRAVSATVKVENPLLRSGLALAGANLIKTSTDDGILTALEATGLNLWGTKLVTLSACDTGLGEVRIGEGVYGLRRAFVLAGAETLVMSLWPVSDFITRGLMAGYYKNLKQGLGRGEALRQVQLDMLKRKGREHPFYWASFIQSGEWANLDGKR